jgi:hypothetical protein
LKPFLEELLLVKQSNIMLYGEYVSQQEEWTKLMDLAQELWLLFI